jgi:O-antigen ligase
VTAILLPLVAAGSLFWFRYLERTGRPTAVVAVVWAVLIADATLYPNPSTVPEGGVLHPVIAGFSLRLIDVIIPMALLARATTTGLGRFGGNGLLWMAFAVWIATAGVIGLADGNPLAEVGFQAKIIIYLGAIVLATGIPAHRYIESGHLRRLIGFAAIVAVLMIALDTSGARFDLGAAPPAEETTEAIEAGEASDDPSGEIGPDAATIFVALGIVSLAMALLSPDGRERLPLLLAAAPLFASAAVATQRAALLGLGASIGVLAALLLFSDRRIRMTPTELGLVALAVGALLVTSAVGTTVFGEGDPELPLESEISRGISSREEQLTTEDRLNQWNEAVALIGERPVFGWGLGTTLYYFEPGSFEFVRTDVTHNLPLDILLRSGIVGLLLFIAAVAFTWIRGLRALRAQGDDLLAGLALGALAAVAGILAKAAVESVFEDYRLAVLLALMLGLVGSVSASTVVEPAVRRRRLRRRVKGAPAPA